jgi:hypothetical protein
MQFRMELSLWQALGALGEELSSEKEEECKFALTA